MFQDIFPCQYDNQYRPGGAGGQAWVLQYRDGGVMARQGEEKLILPGTEMLSGQALQQVRYACSVDGTAYVLADPKAELPPEFAPIPSLRFREMEPRETAFACAVGESLARWYAGNRFCGACGGKMQHSAAERAMVCAACGRTVYPRINPAVITAITDGERLLLTKYAGRAFRRYALVAGFNEIGESIEDTVRREVREETGLQVKNLRFYKSQPWVFTDTLLMGFYCDLDGSDEIRRQEDELSEATWFDRGELPEDHSAISLTGEMIERFRRRENP